MQPLFFGWKAFAFLKRRFKLYKKVKRLYSTVTDFARFRGLSTSKPLATLI